MTRPRPVSPPVSQLLGDNVQRIRTEQGLSRAQLEERLGWSADAVKRIETGRRGGGVSVDELLELALALSVAPVVLLVPWEAEDTVEIAVEGLRWESDSDELHDWIVGAPPPPYGYFGVNLWTYLNTWPDHLDSDQRRQVLKDLEERYGWVVEKGRDAYGTGGRRWVSRRQLGGTVHVDLDELPEDHPAREATAKHDQPEPQEDDR